MRGEGANTVAAKSSARLPSLKRSFLLEPAIPRATIMGNIAIVIGRTSARRDGSDPLALVRHTRPDFARLEF